MPSGKVHTTATMATALALGLSDAGSGPMLGALAGVLISPDLDVNSGFIGFRFIRKVPVIGGVLASFWRAIWYPYARAMPHRGTLSHLPVLSTMIRFAYMVVALSPIWGTIYVRHGWLPDVFPFLAGLVAVDTLHALMDWAQTAWRKRGQ